MDVAINIDQEKVVAFCKRRHIRRFAFFGSVLRDDFRPDGDVDVLVEFKAGYRLGLLESMRIQREFSELVGREADFRTVEDIGRHMRDRVISQSKVVYAA